MKLTGTCALCRSGLPKRVPIEFDVIEQTIKIWLPLSQMQEFVMVGQCFKGKRLPITDIQVVTPTAQLSCSRLPPAFVSSTSGAGFSLDDGEINKIIAVGDNRIQAISLQLTLYQSKIVFGIAPFSPAVQLNPETMYTNHGIHLHERFDIRLGKKTLNVRYSPKHVFIRGRTTATDREILKHALSLLSLGPEQQVTQLSPPRLTLNYAWSTTKSYGESVVDRNDLPTAFQSIVTHLSSCTSIQRERRFNEILHMVTGFQQAVYVEHRLTNLLKALESFDGTRTMAANQLSTLLQIDLGDAKFICGIRNELIHKGIPLKEASVNIHADLTRKGVKLKRFKSIPKTEALPWRVYITFSRLIVEAFFRQFGINSIQTVYAHMKGF
ncbi:MAG: hypothetical protein GXY61_02865 [Lentisphaerae bacterium]|nr:hypothetical protein [Lentisphaerota bacterium]